MNIQGAKIVLAEPQSRHYINDVLLSELASAGLDIPHYTSVEELMSSGEHCETAEVLITLTCSAEVMTRLPRLRAIINPYTGSEHIDREAANNRTIIIGNCAAIENSIGLAEATILLLLASFYNLAESERTLRENIDRPPITARMIRRKTIGLIGYGQISQAVTARLLAWEADLLVSAPRLHASLPPGVRHVELDELLVESDAVLVLCALSKGTRNLLSRERLSLMKSSAVLVNTARGGIVDEEAVADMLMSGRLRRAALDTFAIEPLPADSRLRQAPNAILTPHMIGHSVEAQEAMALTAAENARRILQGKPPLHVFNPEIQDSWKARYGAATAMSFV